MQPHLYSKNVSGHQREQFELLGGKLVKGDRTEPGS